MFSGLESLLNIPYMQSVKPHTEQGASVLPDNLQNSALHVVTNSEGTSSPILSSSVDQCGPEQNLHVETKVTCPEDGILPSQYPWKHELAVKVD